MTRRRFSRSSRSARPASQQRSRQRRLSRLESLEDRHLLTTMLDAAFDANGLVTRTATNGNDNSYFDAAEQVVDDERMIIAVLVGETIGSSWIVNRYTESGQLDANFGTGGEVEFTPPEPGSSTSNISGGIAVNPDNGKIVVASNYDNDFGVFQLNEDGTPDSSFGVDGFVAIDALDDPSTGADRVGAVALQSDGKIVVGGTTNGNAYAIVRLTETGALDSSFDGDGVVNISANAALADIAIFADPNDNNEEKIVATGNATQFETVRLDSDGALDTSFGGTGRVSTNFVPGGGAPGGETAYAVVMSGTKTIVAGAGDNGGGGGAVVLSYDYGGSLSNSFGTGGIAELGYAFSNHIRDAAVQSDGKLVIATSGFNFGVGRLLADGSWDESFGSGGFEIDELGPGGARSVAISNNGKILLAGNFNGDSAVARFDPNAANEILSNDGYSHFHEATSADGFIQFRVSQPLESDATVFYEFVESQFGATATLDADFTDLQEVSGQFTLPAGEYVGQALFSVLDDDEFEPTERIAIRITGVDTAPGDPDVIFAEDTRVEAPITDDDGASISGTNWFDWNGDGIYNEAEETYGSQVTVQRLVEPDPEIWEDVTTFYATNYNTGPSLGDGTYRIKFDSQNSSIVLTEQNAGSDDTVDSDAGPAGADIGYSDPISLVAGQVIENVSAGWVGDGIPAVRWNEVDTDVAEPDGTAHLQIELSSAHDSDVVFTVEIASWGQAEIDVDYFLSTDSAGQDVITVTSEMFEVTVPANATTADVFVHAIDDNDYEGVEDINLTAISNGADLPFLSSGRFLYLADNETPPILSLEIADGLLAEPANNGSVIVSVDQSFEEDKTLTVDFYGSATYGQDYEVHVGGAAIDPPDGNRASITLPANETQVTMDIIVLDDNDQEGNENVFVELRGISGQTSQVENGQANLNIGDDDNQEFNDFFDNPYGLGGFNEQRIANNNNFTSENGEPFHGGEQAQASAWWSWWSQSNVSMTVETCGSAFDTRLGVYTGDSVGELEAVQGDTTSCDGGSSFTFQANQYTEYRFAVDGVGGATGVYSLSLQANVADLNNDHFADAAVLNGTEDFSQGFNEGFSSEDGEPSHAEASPQRSAWWTWTAPTGGGAYLETCGTTFGTALAVYTGPSLDNLTEVTSGRESNVDGCYNQSKVQFLAEPDTTYFIAVDTLYDDQGLISLSLNLVDLPQDPEIGIQRFGEELEDNNAQDSNFEAGTVGFPLATVGQAGQTYDLTIRNDGSSDLTLGNVTLSGDGANNFVVNTDNMAPTLSFGQTTTLQVTYFPQNSGSTEAVLQIANNDSDENPFDLVLQGFAIEVPENIVVSLSSDDNNNFGEEPYSLEEAVWLANAAADLNTITFASSLNGTPIEIANNDSIYIQSPVNIVGNGAGTTILNGRFNRMLYVEDNGGDAVDVQISGVTLQGGEDGAIWNQGQNLTITNSSISNNSGFRGAGISNNGNLTITGSTISGNTANNSGGAVYNNYGTVTITNSTVSGNANDGNRGGGVYNRGGSVTILNSTISNNHGQDGGGGIYNRNGTARLDNTIVAGNTSNSGPSDIQNGDGGNVDAGSSNNLIGDASSSGGLTHDTNGNKVGVDGSGTLDVALILDPLANNGGFTQTHALVNDSPAIDSGDSNAAAELDTDQRGANRVEGAAVDIGAFEFGATLPPGEIVVEYPGGTELVDGESTLTAPLTAVNQSSQLTITIRNTGLSPLDVTEVLLLNANGQFSLNTDDLAGSVPVSGSTSFVVIFQPTLEGLQSANLQIHSSDDDESPFDIALEGTGIVPPPADLVVDALGDVEDGDYDAGQQTLREAITRANILSDVNTITFSEDLDGSPILLDAALPAISNPVNLIGNGASNTIVDAQQNARVFEVNDGNGEAQIDVTLSGMTIQNGQAPMNENGGGILNQENLTIQSVAVSGNSIRWDGQGEAPAFGAGIHSDGTLTLRDSTVSGNSAPTAAFGAISLLNGTLENVTVSGNSAFVGAGVGALGFSGDVNVSILNSTIVNNAASANVFGPIGGLAVFGDNPQLSLDNSILAGNTVFNADTEQAEPHDFYLESGGGLFQNNVFGEPDGIAAAGYQHGWAGNILGDGNGGVLALSSIVDPLGDNGGSTQTHALAVDSPAWNAGNNGAAASLDTDQRGLARVADCTVDIGAFEQQATVSGSGADLCISKSAPPTAAPGGELPFTLSVRNQGPDEAVDVVVTDTLPQGVSLPDVPEDCTEDQGVVTCTVASLPSGESAEFQFAGLTETNLDEGTLLTNTASVTSGTSDPNEDNNSASVATLIFTPSFGEADISAFMFSEALGFENPSIAPGESFDLLAIAFNSPEGPAGQGGPDTAEGVVLTATLPSDVSITNLAVHPDGAPGTCEQDQNVITCNFDPIPYDAEPGAAAAIISLDVSPDATGELAFSVSVAADSDDPNPDNNTSSYIVSVVPSNATPVVEISSPNDGELFELGTSVSFSATATDAEDGDLTSEIDWISTQQGLIGTGGTFSSSDLVAGTHTIYAQALDSEEELGFTSITVHISENGNTLPDIQIISPEDSSSFISGSDVQFSGTASDQQDGDLSGNIAWSSSINGSLGEGSQVTTSQLSAGQHTITAIVTDNGGLVAETQVTIIIEEQQQNSPPEVGIESPESDSFFLVGEDILFSGSAFDQEDGDLSNNLTWTSNLDGEIGEGPSFVRGLSVGEHIITASVTDLDGASSEAQVAITVSDDNTTAPDVFIDSPLNDSFFTVGQSIAFSGGAIDQEDGDISSTMIWSSSINGSIGNGPSFNSDTLSIGNHVITATASDSGDLVGEAQITITVEEPVNTPPEIALSLPENESVHTSGADVEFAASAGDAEDGDLTAEISWNSSVDGAIGNGGSFNLSSLSVGVHQITASVADTDGAEAAAEVTIVINGAPVIAADQVFDVDEGLNNVTLGSVAATDPNEGTTFQNWTIVGGSSVFSIDASTGVLSLTGGPLDFESQASYSFELTVEDNYGLSSLQQEVTVSVNDVNEPPVVDAGQSASAPEDTPVGTTLLTLTGSDPENDTLQGWAIASGNTAGVFSLDAATGDLKVASPLDFETVSSYTLSVTVGDGQSTSASEPVAVTITNVNEAPVVVTGQLFTVSESAASSDSVGTALAQDPDAGDTQQNWTITAGNTGSAFAMDPATGAISVSDDSQVSVANSPFTLTVTVDDAAGLTSATETVRVVVTSDNSPVFVDGQGNVNVIGNGDGNRIIVSPGSGGRVNVTLDNQAYNGFSTSTGHLIIVGGDGDNEIVIAGGFANPMTSDITVDDGRNYVAGGVGDDHVNAGGGRNTILTGNGDDTVTITGDAKNIVDGGAGDDTITTGGGGDEIVAGDGDDIVFAGAGDDLVAGGLGDDILFGQDGDDTLSGGGGDDILVGGAGNDELFGRIGNDIIIGSDGSDGALGNDGDDLLICGRTVNDNDPVQLRLALVAWQGNPLSIPTQVSSIIDDGSRDALVGSTGDDFRIGQSVVDFFDRITGNDNTLYI